MVLMLESGFVFVVVLFEALRYGKPNILAED